MIEEYTKENPNGGVDIFAHTQWNALTEDEKETQLQEDTMFISTIFEKCDPEIIRAYLVDNCGDVDSVLNYFMKEYQDTECDQNESEGEEEKEHDNFDIELAKVVEEEVKTEIAQAFLKKYNLPPDEIKYLVDTFIDDLELCEEKISQKAKSL